jgi:IS30 family transposase
MTDIQKRNIQDMRSQGVAYSQIADSLGISVNTVKSFCRRNNLTVSNASNDTGNEENKEQCKQCGKKLIQTPKAKPKTFCCDKCRFDWWNKQKNKTNRRSVHRLACEYCNRDFGSHDKKRKYCRHDCYIAARFGSGAREAVAAI